MENIGMVFYWANVFDIIKFLSIFLCVVPTALLIFYSIVYLEEDERNIIKYKRGAIKSFFAFLILIFIFIFIPDKETYLSMKLTSEIVKNEKIMGISEKTLDLIELKIDKLLKKEKKDEVK